MAGAPIKEQTDSPLLDLPAELRNWIYGLVATGINEAVITSKNSTPSISDVQHPLSQTCRQLRDEFSSYATAAARTAKNVMVRCRNFDIPSRNQFQALVLSLPPKRFHVYTSATSVDANLLQNFANKIKDILRRVTVSALCKCHKGGRINATVKIDFGDKGLDPSSLQRAFSTWTTWSNMDCECYTESEPVGSAVRDALKDAVRHYRARRSGTEQRRLEEKRRLWCKRRAERD